jgi:hypothetical protein
MWQLCVLSDARLSPAFLPDNHPLVTENPLALLTGTMASQCWLKSRVG